MIVYRGESMHRCEAEILEAEDRLAVAKAERFRWGHRRWKRAKVKRKTAIDGGLEKP